jgi:hypothetical protein
MELKTNEDGKAIIDVLPIGDTVRLQIIAKGFQTLGTTSRSTRKDGHRYPMKRPGEQYSIYKKHTDATQGGKNPDADQALPPAPGCAARSQPADSAKPPEAEPVSSVCFRIQGRQGDEQPTPRRQIGTGHRRRAAHWPGDCAGPGAGRRGRGHHLPHLPS